MTQPPCVPGKKDGAWVLLLKLFSGNLPVFRHFMNSQPVLGILGSGQLAQMIALAAVPLGIRTHVLQKKPEDSGAPWTATVGDWDDPNQASRFAGSVDAVTLENEFVNQAALQAIEQRGSLLRPTAASVQLVQDKLLQKETLTAHGIAVPSFCDVPTLDALTQAGARLGWPLVLKRRRLGYDGKGNATVRGPEDAKSAWDALGGDLHPLFAEAWCPFVAELAMIITRAIDGRAAHYPLVETLQKDHICHVVKAPARVTTDVANAATRAAQDAVAAFGGVGSWGVEMFLLADGRVLLNELAPRVHNSGHYTIEACICSQFENHVRAVMGLPLGSTQMVRPAAAMVNLLGATDGPGVPTGLEKALGVAGAHIHLYGKSRSMKARKMGHVTALGESVDEALNCAMSAAQALRFGT